ncbi:ABC transporter substrate-binding protein [Chloroflexus aggregans]|uniref:Extracellular solute-binding protein family 5 n=1 Tax=Chloroflexus aggregans (strain MD-66 / DSM 9485) TaxID=326427 RepID=B8GAR1_CHLAD|nr:ABC transporter substrate-binding protein [Chloroflexus aggregans]ACL24650.1 extracellular solute-binding protein family 5 [Chloroflexus aggregans DSM 9485]
MHGSDERLQILHMARSEVLAGRMSRRAFLRLGLALGLSAGATALVACSNPSPTPTPVQSAPTPTGAGGRLRVATEIPVQLDPAFASSDAEILILNHVYDYLVDIDANNAITPRLAREWTVSDDGLRYRFTLHDGVTFHDGSRLTAADVVWTFNRLRDPALQLPTADLYANIADIAEENETTVAFTLSEPNPFFLYDLSDNHALILRAGTTNAATSFNGTGPFKVVEYRTENRIDLVAATPYFQAGKPLVSALEIIFFADQAAAVDALRGGQVDLVLRMPTPLFQTLQQTTGIVTVQTPTNGFDLVRLRSDREPGNKPEVIRALKLATDRQAIFQQVKAGLGAVGRDSPIGPLFSAYYSEETPLPPRDPAAARALLETAGYRDGLKLDLHVPDSGDRPDLAVVLKEQWAEAGIDVNVIVEPESVYYGDDRWLEVDLGITGWGSRPVPQFYLDVMLVSGAIWNESHFSDAEFDALAALARTTLNEDERVRAYREIQRILIERGPIIIPYFFAQLSAHREGLRGYVAKAFPGRTDLASIAV